MRVCVCRSMTLSSVRFEVLVATSRARLQVLARDVVS